jgi:hypothetical protein
MSIKSDIEREVKNNDYTLDIIEADELIAVWRYRQSNRFKRSVDFSMVPKEWRYSAPMAGSNECIACHVSYRRQNSTGYSCIAPENGSQRRSSLSMPDLTELEPVGFAKRNVAPYISPILDTGTLALVCKDLGLTGKAIPKVINGRQYIVLTGYAGFRNYLPGTLYTANNRKIIQMAIGEMGIINMVKKGARLTICLTVSLTILECILKDQITMSQIIGHVSSDLIKIGISSLLSVLAGLVVGSVFTVAALPIIVTIGVGIFTGWAVETIDKHYGLTDKLVAALEKLGDQINEVQAIIRAGQYRGQEAQFGWSMITKTMSEIPRY